mmetsp:Transcript_27109/g.57583  ORF Transcript_27109/g.57583 Transcript_27109/m.57583 type:complete len:205 (+) Transcript_27109:428-1042(+)
MGTVDKPRSPSRRRRRRPFFRRPRAGADETSNRRRAPASEEAATDSSSEALASSSSFRKRSTTYQIAMVTRSVSPHVTASSLCTRVDAQAVSDRIVLLLPSRTGGKGSPECFYRCPRPRPPAPAPVVGVQLHRHPSSAASTTTIDRPRRGRAIGRDPAPHPARRHPAHPRRPLGAGARESSVVCELLIVRLAIPIQTGVSMMHI